MKIKQIFLIGVILLCLVGCTNVKDLSYDDIVNTISEKGKNPNNFKKGFQYYVPKGLILEDAGSNYSVFTSNDITYYLYVDLVSYFNKSSFEYNEDKNLVYSKKINNNGKSGYVQIKLWENNQYLIEIMYNYAKIEVMVEENLINKVLVNSISILNSIEYNDDIIEKILNNDNLSYTEEKFELFEKDEPDREGTENESETLEPEVQEEVKDTDFIN